MKIILGNLFITALLLILLFLPCTLQAQWIQLSGGPENDIISDIAADNHNLYAASAGPSHPGIFITTDHGTSWFIPESAIISVNGFAIADSAVFAGTGGGGVYRSTNGGLSWISRNSGLTNTNVNIVFGQGVDLFAGTFGSGVFHSTDQGGSWIEKNNGLTNLNIISIASNGSYLFAGTYGGGVYRSGDNGVNWDSVNAGLNASIINSLCTIGPDVFAGSPNGIYRTADSGATWVKVNSGLSDTNITALCFDGTNIFAAVTSQVFLLSDYGDNWIDVNSGLPAGTPVISLASDSTFLYAGLYYNGIWRRRLSEMITSAEILSGNFPLSPILYQNYPNPFNPSTELSFVIGNFSFVTLKVYDILGREVATLVDEVKQPGEYSVKWNAEGIPGGVYFYRIITNDFIETKKMLLIR